MVIEHFKNNDALAVYRRFNNEGRKMPEGLKFIESWVAANLSRCFQIVECDDLALIQRWISDWQDIVEFEVVPIVTSKQTFEIMKPKL